MKQYQYFLLLLTAFIFFQPAKAQFGYKRKADIEKFKDSRLVVVLFADSAYNASIQHAVEKYWNFSGGYVFAYDTAMKPYMKGNYSFLLFSKSKGTKIKAKLGSCEVDFNGLMVLNKFRKRATEEELIATAFCGNTIDTADWLPELIRGVQLLNTYFNIAIEAKGDREAQGWYLKKDYPSDKTLMSNKKLLIESRLLEMKGKEDAQTILDGEIEELADDMDIQKAILDQSSDVMYYYFSNDEKHCNKLVLTAEGSQLMYYSEEPMNKCKCNASDLKKMKLLKSKGESDDK